MMHIENKLLQTARNEAAGRTGGTQRQSADKETVSEQKSPFGKLLQDRANEEKSRVEESGALVSQETEETGAAEEIAVMMSALMYAAPPIQIQTQGVQPTFAVGESTAAAVEGAQAAAFPAEMTEADAAMPIAQESIPLTQDAHENRGEMFSDVKAVKITAERPESGESAHLTGEAPKAQVLQAADSQGNRPEADGGDGAENAQAQYGQPVVQPLFRNLESTPVKVGETPVVDTQSADLEGQLAETIETGLADGAQKVKIQLTPENLGTVTIDLTRTQDGALQVVFHTSNEKTASLLSRHAEALGAMLQNTAQSTVQVEVQRGEQNQQSQQFQQQNQQHGGQNPHQQERRSHAGEDFLQQLRLGLVTLDEQAG